MATDVLVSFDDTGSMSSCIHEVRLRVIEMVGKLFDNIPDLRIGIIAHGDYCDGDRAIESIDLTSDRDGLVRFVRNTHNTGGGDSDEFYELILHMARGFSWREDASRLMIMIGDAQPHPVGYRYGGRTYTLDWKEEAFGLAKMNVNIYAVQALGNRSSNYFYQGIADMTNGRRVELHQFSDTVESIISIFYHSVGRLGEYKNELETTFRMNRNLANLLSDLDSNLKPVSSIFVKKDASGLIPVSPSRFQILTVDRPTDIKTFVESLGITFRKGRGFYEFQKSEIVQEHKEVILQNRYTGDMFTGDEARNFIGLPYGTRGRISPGHFEEYRVFIQSTSSNRKLIPGYKFLYDLE